MPVFNHFWTVPERWAFLGISQGLSGDPGHLGEGGEPVSAVGRGQCPEMSVKIVDDPKGRHDDLVKPYFENAQPDQVLVIIKAREPAGYMVAIGAGKKWHLETEYRWVQQFNFYIQDSELGTKVRSRMPILSARICLDQHYWLALR
jgi:hypothetical protein